MSTPAQHLYLFDVDGTLLRLDGAGRQALGTAFGDIFQVPSSHDLMQSIRFDGSTDTAILQEAIRRMDLTPERFALHRERFELSYLGHLERLVAEMGAECVLPSIVNVLETLEKCGATLGLLTGNSEAGARVKLEPFGLNRFFPIGAFGSDHADRVVLAGLARQRLEKESGRSFLPRDIFVIGDSVMDVRCGKAHRFSTVAVTTGWTSREVLLEERPDYLLEELGQLLAEPDHTP